jgi:hypothetical protein
LTDEDVNPIKQFEKKTQKKIERIAERRVEKEAEQRRLEESRKAKVHKEDKSKPSKPSNGGKQKQTASMSKLGRKSPRVQNLVIVLENILSPQKVNRDEMQVTWERERLHSWAKNHIMRESPVSGGVRLGRLQHDLTSNAGMRPSLVKRTPAFTDRGGDILTGALVASASAVIAGAVYVVGWVWSEKYGERKAIEDELSEDESEEAIEAEEEEAEEEEKEEEDEDEEDVEENKASQIKKRGIRIHARHRTPEALTPTHWRE